MNPIECYCIDKKNVDYYTPKSILDFFGPFDYDPATTEILAKEQNLKNFDTKETNGLKSDWTKFKKIWINPPFDIKFDFLKKAV